MMDKLGLNNDVLVGERRFHVQTSFSESAGTATTNVFDDGQVVMSKSIEVGSQVDARARSARLKDLHQELITEIEILYYIYEKVKTVRHAPSANKLGLLFLQHNLLREAIEQFEFAHKIDPDLHEVLPNLGRAYVCTGAYDAAIDILNKGAEEAPHYADIQNYLGIAHIYKSDYSEAIRHLEKAVELNQNYVGAFYHLGVAYAGASLQSDTPEIMRSKAHDYFLRAAERQSTCEIPSFHKVKSLVEAGEFQEAIATFQSRQAREVLSHFFNIEHEFYLKFMYGGKGKDERFISQYVDKVEELIGENPTYADMHNSLGIAHLIQCRNLFLKALDEFRTALRINPTYRKAQKNLKLAENDGKGFLILLRAILK